jgi:AcrR family transcriptional regulator
LSSQTTKRKIIQAAISLFNEMGLVNVRLQHISDATIISLGNITYHYKTKDAIIGDIWRQLQAEQRTLLAEFRTLPLFEDIDRYLLSSFQLQHKYRFFYQDTLEVVRAYPEIGESHREHIRWQEQQLGLMFTFNLARGAFSQEPEPGFYQSMAGNWLWMLENWLQRQEITGCNPLDYAAFNTSLWNALLPVFSPQGHMEYQQLLQLKNLPNDAFTLLS